MSVEFLIAFGGPLFLGLIGVAVQERMRRPDDGEPSASRGANVADIDATLASAQAAAREAEAGIARARARLAS